MIKFIESSETKLKFVSYPILKFYSYLIILAILIPWLYWSVFISPANASLNCQRTVLNHVDCQLQKSNLLGVNLTTINIINLRKANLFTPSDPIALKANPHSNRDDLLSNIIGFQNTYFYPSKNPFSLVIFSNYNSQNWLRTLDQGKKVNQFILGDLNQKYLSIEQKITWIQALTLGFFSIFTPFLIVVGTIKSLLNNTIKTIYEFDGINKILKIQLKSIRKQKIIEYGFDSINQIRLDEDNTKNMINGRIILQFNPDQNYPIEEFVDLEYGKKNLQIIQEFLKQDKSILLR